MFASIGAINHVKEEQFYKGAKVTAKLKGFPALYAFNGHVQLHALTHTRREYMIPFTFIRQYFVTDTQ